MYKYVKFRNYYNLHVNTSEFQTPNNNKSFFSFNSRPKVYLYSNYTNNFYEISLKSSHNKNLFRSNKFIKIEFN